jgi:hypothetical protein
MKLELVKQSDRALAKALSDFRTKNQTSTELNIDSISFNGTRVQYLTYVLRRNGAVKNRLGQPVQQLVLGNCSFEDEESLLLVASFFANNESPKTVSSVGLFRSEQLWSRLFPGFHLNDTVKKLHLKP